MKAIVVEQTDKEQLLSWQEVPDVACGPDQVIVDIKATAVNRADLLQAQGLYPAPPGESEILGLEMCGVISAVGAYLSQDLNLLRVNGRLIIIGLLGGSMAEINLGSLLGKGLRIIGTRLRARPLTEKISITREFRERFWPMLEQGRLQPVIDKVFPIEEAQAAHDHVRQNANTGKVVLEM